MILHLHLSLEPISFLISLLPPPLHFICATFPATHSSLLSLPLSLHISPNTWDTGLHTRGPVSLSLPYLPCCLLSLSTLSLRCPIILFWAVPLWDVSHYSDVCILPPLFTVLSLLLDLPFASLSSHTTSAHVSLSLSLRSSLSLPTALTADLHSKHTSVLYLYLHPHISPDTLVRAGAPRVTGCEPTRPLPACSAPLPVYTTRFLSPSPLHTDVAPHLDTLPVCLPTFHFPTSPLYPSTPPLPHMIYIQICLPLTRLPCTPHQGHLPCYLLTTMILSLAPLPLELGHGARATDGCHTPHMYVCLHFTSHTLPHLSHYFHTLVGLLLILEVALYLFSLPSLSTSSLLLAALSSLLLAITMHVEPLPSSGFVPLQVPLTFCLSLTSLLPLYLAPHVFSLSCHTRWDLHKDLSHTGTTSSVLHVYSILPSCHVPLCLSLSSLPAPLPLLLGLWTHSVPCPFVGGLRTPALPILRTVCACALPYIPLSSSHYTTPPRTPFLLPSRTSISLLLLSLL